MMLSPKFLVGVAAGAATGYVIGQVSCGVPLSTALGRVLNPAAILGALADTFKAATRNAGVGQQPATASAPMTYIPPPLSVFANMGIGQCPPGFIHKPGFGTGCERDPQSTIKGY